MSRRWGRAERARLDGWITLAERGWRLFPIRPGTKVPAISQWSQRATSDPDRLAQFYRAHPDHNAGIACGPSGLLVVDCDIPRDDRATTRWVDGSGVFDDLAGQHGGAPATWTVATPSGGRHLYYAAPGGRVLGNTSRVLGPLLDTRGDGGQVLAPGSVLPAGGYELLDDTDPAPLPDWLSIKLTPPPVTAAPTATQTLGDAVGRPLTTRHAGYVTSAVAAEAERVRRARRGGHNTAIFTAANALGQLVGAGALDRAEAEAAITVAAEHICAGPCDCTPRDVAASIRSGLDRGTRNPRRLPGSAASPRSRVTGGNEMNVPDHDATERIVTDYEDELPAADPGSDGRSRSLGPDEREHLAQRGVEPAEAVEQAVLRIEHTDPDDLVPVDVDSPAPAEVTDPGHISPGSAFEAAGVYTNADLAAIADAMARHDEEAADRLRGALSGPSIAFALRSVENYSDHAPAVAGMEAPADADEAAFAPPAAAERSIDRGLADDRAIARAEEASRTAAAAMASVVPASRSSPDADEGERRAHLAQWHVADEGAAQSTGDGIER